MTRHARHLRNRRDASAFTFVELILGLVVTMLVTGALAAFSFAMANSWRRSESAQTLYLAGNQAMARIQSVMRSARQVGLVRAGSAQGKPTPAAIMLWKADTNNDGKISFSEVALLEHDPAADELKFYEAAPTAINDWIASTAFITDSAAPETFKALNYVTGKKIARNVKGAQFVMINNGSHTQRPVFECTLYFRRDGQIMPLYGSAAMQSIDAASN